MFGQFDRPVGAAADVRELEYLSSLHQTGAGGLREDGTVSADDVRLYLRSRYGVDVAPREALDVMRGLGGTFAFRRRRGHGTTELEANDEEARLGWDAPAPSGTDESKENGSVAAASAGDGDGGAEEGCGEEEEYLDLVQLTSILLIPTLLRAAAASASATGGSSARTGINTSGIAHGVNPYPLGGGSGGSAHDRYVRFGDDAAPQGEGEDEDEDGGTADRCMYSWIIRHFLSLAKDAAASSGANGADGDEGVAVDAALVRTLLESFNEPAAAADGALVRDMVDAAGGGRGAVLDERSLAAALTADVRAWRVGLEDSPNETFVDVYGFEPVDAAVSDGNGNGPSPGHDGKPDAKIEMTTVAKIAIDTSTASNAETFRMESVVSSDECDRSEGTAKVPTYIGTAPYIDYVVDNSRSILYSMFLWVFYVFSVGVLMKVIGTTEPYLIGCDTSFGCSLVNQIWHWIVFGAILCGAGLVVIVPTSLGNDPYERGWKATALSATLLLAFSITPYVITREYKKGIPHSEDGVLTDLEIAVSDRWVGIASLVYLLCGCSMTLLLLISHLPKIIGDEGLGKYHPILQHMMRPSNALRCASMKRSATHKLINLLGNARELHTTDTSGGTSAMENFVLHGERSEECGGLLWTWKRILNRDISEKHGVWIPLRFFAGQEGQIITLILLIAVLVVGTKELAEQAQARRDEIASEQWSSGVETALYFLPTPWMIYASFYTGGIIAVVAAFAIILLYIPSTISTVLKLRSGVIQSLHDPQYSTFRSGAASINNNMGNMIYGLAGSASFFFVFFGGLVFLTIWPPTKSGMALLWAWGLGLMITIALKMALTSPCEKAYNAAFYRTRPREANITSLALQCWNLGLGSSVLIGRLTQFLLASAFWVGRVDVNFLDGNVSILGYQFDYAPANFRTEILVHEAHRHPFIDRLGAMYMMRMKHGTNFSSDAGACWRRLFVQAIMPWLEKFRQFEADEDVKVMASMERVSSSIIEKVGGKAAASSEVRNSKEGVSTDNLRDEPEQTKTGLLL